MTRPLFALALMVLAIYGALAIGAGAAHLRAAAPAVAAADADEIPERIAKVFALPL